MRVETVLVSTQHTARRRAGRDPRLRRELPLPRSARRLVRPARRDPRESDGTVHRRRTVGRLRRHRPQDHRRHVRRHGAPWRRRVQRQGPVEGRSQRRVLRPLRRATSGDATGLRQARRGAGRLRDRPRASRCRCESTRSAPATWRAAAEFVRQFDYRPAAMIERLALAPADLPADDQLRALREAVAQLGSVGRVAGRPSLSASFLNYSTQRRGDAEEQPRTFKVRRATSRIFCDCRSGGYSYAAACAARRGIPSGFQQKLGSLRD